MNSAVAAFAICLAVAFAVPAVAAPVDVELVLSVDSSGSIDEDEFALQRQGYAGALVDPEILDAIRRGPNHAIAVTLVEWSGPAFKTVVVPWMRIAGKEDAEKFAAILLHSPRTIFGGGTSIGAAILHAATLFDGNGFEGQRRVIDVSGDGFNNRGVAPEQVRDQVAGQGITINGLAILEDEGDYLLHYYERAVIAGPGAFAIGASGFRDFADAVRRKLKQELILSSPLGGGTRLGAL